MKKPLGYIVYEGTSQIDGAPIVVILNKIHASSNNAKTGALIQSFIIRSDVHPVDALRTGDDVSICGQCEHRPVLAKKTGKAPCYVNVGKSVAQVYKAYKRDRYQRVTPAEAGILLAGRQIRIGTYGDPYACPVDVWEDVTSHAKGWTGYTHQWQRKRFNHARWSRFVMASTETIDQSALANLYGMRTFRVSIGIDRQPLEATCPASKEAGARTTCADCMLCGGTSKTARDIVIADHALGHKNRVIKIQKVPA